MRILVKIQAVFSWVHNY